MTPFSDRFTSISDKQVKLFQATGSAGEPAKTGSYKSNIFGIKEGLYHKGLQRDITSVADLKT